MPRIDSKQRRADEQLFQIEIPALAYQTSNLANFLYLEGKMMLLSAPLERGIDRNLERAIHRCPQRNHHHFLDLFPLICIAYWERRVLPLFTTKTTSNIPELKRSALFFVINRLTSAFCHTLLKVASTFARCLETSRGSVTGST
eukprot:gb/GECG01005868.1/.p1 GENE.gb/GECG01005868.1/~~gb/GECG01005868.1/.p1  ORF type:complete len:144 (+),score=8.52 gb/GECG01005868.1/:1-432(+)